MIGKNEHFVKNSKEFTESIIRHLRVEPEEELRSYDVSALFTSVTVDKAIEVIRARLELDTTLHERTPLQVPDVVKLLELCLKCTYFVFQGEFYQQIHGASMGSPVSPIACNF